MGCIDTTDVPKMEALTPFRFNFRIILQHFRHSVTVYGYGHGLIKLACGSNVKHIVKRWLVGWLIGWFGLVWFGGLFF
jgi:hypothetical protein